MDLNDRRRHYAEEIAGDCQHSNRGTGRGAGHRAARAISAAGPWLIRSEIDYGGGPRQTPDNDPHHVYHNVAIAIDPARQLFNGAPSLVSICIDALSLNPAPARCTLDPAPATTQRSWPRSSARRARSSL